jgi:hypothetical protein
MSASQEIPEGMPQHASYWYRRWLVAQEGLDEEAEQRIAERGNRDLMHADLGDLLEACGMGNFARPQSSHEVMREAIAKVRTLATEGAAAELARQRQDGPGAPDGPDPAERHTFTRDQLADALSRITLHAVHLAGAGSGVIVADWMADALIEALND